MIKSLKDLLDKFSRFTNSLVYDGGICKRLLEKKLNKNVMDEQKILLENAVALQLKNEFLTSTLGYEQINILKEAVATAAENSELNLKGFEYEMVEARDLVQSQLTEAYIRADYLKNVHDYLLSLATIDKLIGQKLDESF